MALMGFAFLEGASSGKFAGDCTITDHGGVKSDNAFECYEIRYGARAGAEGYGARGTTHVQLETIDLLKAIDKASPLLFQAVCTNDQIKGTIHIFHNKIGEGDTEEALVLTIENARIVDLQACDYDSLDGNNSTRPASERVRIAAHTITCSHKPGGTEYQFKTNESK